MKVKFLLGQLKILLMIIFSAVFVHPFILYPKRRKIWRMRDTEPEETRLEKKWYFWYADTFETKFGDDTKDDKNYINSTYGLYENKKFRKADGSIDYDKFAKVPEWRKRLMSWLWLVIRNGVWNYIINNAPSGGSWKDGLWENEKILINTGLNDKGEPLHFSDWRDKGDFGKQSITWEHNGKKFFRYSVTRKAKWYNVQRIFKLIFTLKWTKYYNFMWGADDHRYLLKSRVF